jgi:hypothetical protein
MIEFPSESRITAILHTGEWIKSPLISTLAALSRAHSASRSSTSSATLPPASALGWALLLA